jgi:Signal transduction histidine kinase
MIRRLKLFSTTLLLTLLLSGIPAGYTHGSHHYREQPDLQEEALAIRDSISMREVYQRGSIDRLTADLVSEKSDNDRLQQAVHDKEEQLTLTTKRLTRASVIAITTAAILLLLLIYLQYRHRKMLRVSVEEVEERCKREYARKLNIERVHVQMQVLEEERERISRNLHDTISNNLVSIRLQLQSADDRYPNKTELCRLVENTHREIRAIMHNLSSPSLSTMPFEQLFRYHMGLMNGNSSFQVDGMLLPETGWSELNPKLQTELFRLVQEVTGNIVKHSRAARVTVTLRNEEDTITLLAEDDGIGMSTDQISVGFGMKNLKARVEYLGGELQISSSPMSGTVVRICIPSAGSRE